MMKSPSSTFCVGVIFHALFVHYVQANLQQPSTQPSWKRGPPDRVANQCPQGWKFFEGTGTCFGTFSGPLNHTQAQEFCTNQGGSLATVTDDELDFVIRKRWGVSAPWWTGFVIQKIQKDSNSSYWKVASDLPIRQGLSNANIAMPTAIPSTLEHNNNQLCVALDAQTMVVFFLWNWQILPCDQTAAFLCMKEKLHANGCTDRKGEYVYDGENYHPHSDPCMQCKCQDGKPAMCFQPQCAQPRCKNYIPDADLCCTYHCLDGNYNNTREGTPTLPCIDRKGSEVGEGESYKPHTDPCMQCKCQNGERIMCVQTQCAQPRCKNYMPDPDVCCTYHCLDDNDSTGQGIDVTDNMRWVLTMLTSFILLGMMLFMVYRMRQKRMAYLRYRAQQFREGSMMDFEPGSGPPPPPNIDDIDGGGYREPPPPYSFFKVDLPPECPPPYEPTPTAYTHPPDVNRNHDHRSPDLQGEDTALLASGTSEPSTPTDKIDDPKDPPVYTPSSPYIANSDAPSPDTERSIISAAETEGQEPGTPETPTSPSSPVTLLPSINTTV